MTKTALVIGGGPAGCAACHQLSLMGGWNITLVESAPFLGGGGRTFWHGGHPYTFGPRHFLTQDEKVWEYINTYLPMRRCPEHQFLTYVESDANFYNYPIHEDDIPRMPDGLKIGHELSLMAKWKREVPKNLEEYWLQSVGYGLYEKFIKNYSKKMWQREATEIDTFDWSPKGVALKSGPRAAWDSAISAYPIPLDGYNSWFDRIGSDCCDEVMLETEIDVFDFKNRKVWFKGVFPPIQYDIIVSTISPDIPFGHMYGCLPYIGRDFHKIVLPIEFALPKDVYFVYYAGAEKFTRITEFKRFTQHKSPHTLLGMEIPSSNGKFYPLPIKKYQRVAEQYFQEMGLGVFSLGRSGSYRYSLDIAACIRQAMDLVEVLKQGGSDHPVPGKWSKI